jgi:hypothetical protein
VPLTTSAAVDERLHSTRQLTRRLVAPVGPNCASQDVEQQYPPWQHPGFKSVYQLVWQATYQNLKSPIKSPYNSYLLSSTLTSPSGRNTRITFASYGFCASVKIFSRSRRRWRNVFLGSMDETALRMI